MGIVPWSLGIIVTLQPSFTVGKCIYSFLKKGRNCVLSQKGQGVNYQSKAQHFLSSVNNDSETNIEEERVVLQQQKRKEFFNVEFQESQDIVIRKFASSVLSNEKWGSTEIKANCRGHFFCLCVLLCHKNAQGCLWLCHSLKLSHFHWNFLICQSRNSFGLADSFWAIIGLHRSLIPAVGEALWLWKSSAVIPSWPKFLVPWKSRVYWWRTC